MSEQSGKLGDKCRKIIGHAAILLGLASLAFAGHPKIAEDLTGVDPDATVDVIVQYSHPSSYSHFNKLSQIGARDNAHLPLINGEAVRLSRRELEALAEDPEIAHISSDQPVFGSLDYAIPAINGDLAAKIYGYDGTGIGIAVIDSGIVDIPDLHNTSGYKVLYSQNFVGNGGGSAVDQYGHGTHVAGIIGGNGAKSTGFNFKSTFHGVAPNANLISLRVLDQKGVGSDSAVIAAIARAIALKNTYNTKVINLSLGRPIYESYTQDPLCQAVEKAWKAGIVVVVAAGNYGRSNSGGINGYGTISAPGNDPYVITVGAMKTNGTPSRTDDTIASYSSKGPTLFDHIVKRDLVAPGNRVISLYTAGLTLPQLYLQTRVPFSLYEMNGSAAPSDTYYLLSGTSMATPMVSGPAALLLQQNPGLSPDQVKAKLMKTAYKVFPTSSTAVDPTTGIAYTAWYDIFTVGAGYLDIQAALASTDTPSGPATSPSAIRTIDPSGHMVVSMDAGDAIWGKAITWGTAIIWGSNNFVGGTAFLSGNAICWVTKLRRRLFSLGVISSSGEIRRSRVLNPRILRSTASNNGLRPG